MSEKYDLVIQSLKLHDEVESDKTGAAKNVFRTSLREFSLAVKNFKLSALGFQVAFQPKKDFDDSGIDSFANFLDGVGHLVQGVVRLVDGVVLIPSLTIAVPISAIIGLASIFIGKPRYILPMVKAPFESAWVTRTMSAIGLAAIGIANAGLRPQ